MTLAAVLAVLMAIGPVLELDAAAINAMAPLIHKQLMKQKRHPKVPKPVVINPSTCYHFRCAD